MSNTMEVFREIAMRVATVGSLANVAYGTLDRIHGRSTALDDAINLVFVLGEEVERIKSALDTLEEQIGELDCDE